MGPDGKTLPVFEGLPNAHMRLFGGAQYHRAMAEFRTGIGQLICPDISREEIVNACGIDDFHDGVNYTRTACVIAVSKARDMFEPFLHQVGHFRAYGNGSFRCNVGSKYNSKLLFPSCSEGLHHQERLQMHHRHGLIWFVVSAPQPRCL